MSICADLGETSKAVCENAVKCALLVSSLLWDNEGCTSDRAEMLWCLWYLLLYLLAAPYRSCHSIHVDSLYVQHPLLSQQPSASPPSLHPWILSVVFHFSSHLASPSLHPSEPSQPFLSNFAFKALRVAPVMYSFLILSILVTPNKDVNLFSSASYLFVSATISGSQQGHSSPSTPPCIHCLIHHSCICCFGWMIPGI